MPSRTVIAQPIQRGETFRYTTTVNNVAGAPIDLNDEATITSFTITLYRADTNAVINSRNAQSILGTASGGVYPGANQHTLGNTGLLTWNAVAADTSPTITADTKVVARYTLTYVLSGATHVGIHEVQFTIQALPTVS